MIGSHTFWGWAALSALLALPLRAETVTVFAAASLKTALDEIAERYEAEEGARILRTYAGSSVLARQIAQGAPADIYLAANSAWMDHLEAKGAIRAETRRDVVSNTLVLIAREAPDIPDLGQPEAWLGAERLAVALVDAVPAGIYAKAALTSLGIWDEVAPAVVQTDNARAALALVASGAVGFGIVYASDARAEPRVRAIHGIPAALHPPIRYPAALTARARADGAAAFLDHLSGPGARAVFDRWGFLPPGPAAPPAP
ncbi:molybdate ABC transporter substrate-binding protein [Poseidonocella sedimentorum]|uniref:Molybdate-binding protein ModA n=1 Tax=Poseidonocella sedimentorum TaxID=871652 RepID=A0A1I6D4Y9_9RHOB|nr:molybdate ABC transporter substrate-binding protein [Poseidonocella sedimentorum]SFR00544.1 molybdate transport system substrate-binding protein [Poseidonocella sedimentorum]